MGSLCRCNLPDGTGMKPSMDGCRRTGRCSGPSLWKRCSTSFSSVVPRTDAPTFGATAVRRCILALVDFGLLQGHLGTQRMRYGPISLTSATWIMLRWVSSWSLDRSSEQGVADRWVELAGPLSDNRCHARLLYRRMDMAQGHLGWHIKRALAVSGLDVTVLGVGTCLGVLAMHS